MSVRKRVWKLLGKFDRRVVLVEDAVERVGGAVENILAIVAEHRAAYANDSARLERAMLELSRTVRDMLDSMADERERRAGVGREQMRQSSELDHLDRRVTALEGRRSGAAE